MNLILSITYLNKHFMYFIRETRNGFYCKHDTAIIFRCCCNHQFCQFKIRLFTNTFSVFAQQKYLHIFLQILSEWFGWICQARDLNVNLNYEHYIKMWLLATTPFHPQNYIYSTQYIDHENYSVKSRTYWLAK